MTDLGQILPLWRELETAGADYVLATVVAVEGSSYRKPGARMLLAQDGRRAGTVSGGCLEAEVARRAWWLTASGPVVERYSTQDDDGDRPYGSGCGGVVYLLLERRADSGAAPDGFRRGVQSAHAAWRSRRFSKATHRHEGHCRRDELLRGRTRKRSCRECGFGIERRCCRTCRVSRSDNRTSFERIRSADGGWDARSGGYLAAAAGLWIFSAGDDAKPLRRNWRRTGLVCRRCGRPLASRHARALPYRR